MGVEVQVEIEVGVEVEVEAEAYGSDDEFAHQCSVSARTTRP